MHKNRFSRVGYVLAIAGSAIGLGNIWKFPYITGENGGGAFVLVFLLAVFSIGISIFIAEVILGKIVKKDAVTTFEVLSPKKHKYFKYIGFTFITGILIISFYPIVIAWILHYTVLSFTTLPASVDLAEKYFLNYSQTNLLSQISYFTFVFVLIAFIISKGIKKGIEKLNNMLIPALFIIFILMFFYSITLSGFPKAMEFMFKVDFENFDTNSILIAVGHAFFCLSVGVVTILTYSASISEDTHILKATLFVVIMDVLTAFLSGLIIFTIIFSADANVDKGVGLVFITLPAIFSDMGFAGTIFAIFFFLALAFAAITSAVSMIEPAIMYLMERKGYKRLKATITVSAFAYSLGLLAILSFSNDFKDYLTFYGRSFFDWLDFSTSAIMMPLGGIAISIFVAYIADKEVIRKALEPYLGKFLFSLWLIVLRYLTPFAIFVLMLKEAGLVSF
ncbi:MULTISPECIES: sodium-dependent transporter [Arcobacteraceae]|uniref:Transporter n=1 Tax=Aliarcobacter thereius LMG 24486 TaxID=1032240 RepID=A0A1C7WMY2_9BACT|nr:MULTISPECIES: sodium-dependent transporter [Arcobacteraceae]OCL83447.1 Sodium:neurotransmitter symporter family protein [Arcobacter porcinus]OCL95126.1 Sodium:neurotransmitter symporter family protein [Aliarcobacter thereius LMG 24486]QBF16884.1 sodium-dependent transporter, SNF family [Aliarcobacter thereius LMG 24486]TLS94087.1 sodium-dependent transporter [Aliarcobacter thereius]